MNAFKQLDILGFKSFADKININFDGGITAIVGPNGCGKSNVADAIRWVLGEQSSKTLRGKSMQDVIFAGTEQRKKLSYCEVTLVFDNTEKWFNVDYNEVAITRKLYRSGDSEYNINKKPCRLKDITDLLYDCGIGKDGYSIIGQGKIDEIINSKPEDRRNIFEDAAGISKYKARKVESERRLERTRDNMTRMRDIIIEIERQIGPLKQQSENAKAYLEYKEDLKDNEINSFLFQHENVKIAKKEIMDKLEGFNESLAIKNNDLTNCQLKYDGNINEINKIDHSISDIRDDILKYTVKIEEQKGEQNLLSERITHLKQQSEMSKDLLDKYNMEQAQRTEMVTNITAATQECRKNLTTLQNTEKNISEKYLEVIDTLTLAEGEAQTNQRVMLQNLSRLSEIKAGVSSITAKMEALSDNLTLEQRSLEGLRRASASNDNALIGTRTRIDAAHKRIDDVESQMSLMSDELHRAEGQYIAVVNEINDKKNIIINMDNKVNILKNLQADYEGYAFAVKRLLKDSANNLAIRQNIMGVVGNIITVPAQYQTAIEMALGGSIQNIITANESDAKALVEYLKETHSGRATFLPLTSVKSRDIKYEYGRISHIRGVLGIANDLIEYDEKYKNAISSLLGSTVIADTLDNAVVIARASGYSFRIVTLEGEILSAQGAITGGSKKSNDISILGKETEIKTLMENMVTIKRVIAELSARQEKLAQQKIKLSEQVSELVDIINANKIELSSLNSIHNSLQEKQSALADDMDIKSKFIEQINEAIVELSQKKTTMSDESSEDNFDTADENLTARQSMYAELKAKREKYNSEVTDVKVRIAETEQKLNNYEIQILSLENEMQIGVNTINNAKAEYTRTLSVFEMAFSLRAESVQGQMSEEARQKLLIAEDKLKNFDDFKASIMSEIKQLVDKKDSLQIEINRLQNRVYQEEAKLQKFDIDIENIQEKIYEEYELIYSECIKYRREDYEHKQGLIDIAGLRRKINALGAINVSAIEDYKSVSSRYTELNTQMTDLESAEADLVKIIKELSQEMTSRFDVEFKKINENFQQVFKELFGGGNAKLELLPHADPLQSGVEISAEPPGKRLQSITLLSGGEKALTAIAILFAILKLKAMPFCLLDEIEAALDDANVERFAKYLNRFSERTQFIVITHRKPTMELAHSLYGVTMEEKGVSKMVSVLLSDVAGAVSEEDKVG